MTAAEVIPIRPATPFRAVEWVKSIPSGMLMSGNRVDTTARSVLLLLATYANNETGIAWPSQETLSDVSGWEPKTIREALKRLERARLISHVGDRGAKQWLLAIDIPLPDAPDLRTEKAAQRRAQGAARVRAYRARHATTTPVTQPETVTCNVVEQRYTPDVTPSGVSCNAVVDPRTTKELPKTELPKDAAPDVAADGLFEVPEPQPKSETRGQLVNRLARLYTDKVKLTGYLAVQGIVKLAIKSGEYTEQQIAAGMTELASERRVVTANSLRIAIEGPPQSRRALPKRMTVPKSDSTVWQDESAMKF